METYKKKIIILTKTGSSGQGFKGSVQLLRLNDEIKITVDVISKDKSRLKDLIWLFSTSKTYLKESFTDSFRFIKTFSNSYDFERGASFLIFSKSLNEIVSYGHIGEPLITLNNAEDFLIKEDKNITIDYDDEIIATEDYYKIEENELLRDEIKSVRVESEEKVKEGESEKKFSLNEKDFSSFKSNRYYEKIENKLKELFSTHPKCDDLKKTIKNGKFIKINYDDDRYYVVGITYEQGVPAYLAYGVKGIYGNKPLNFENSKFVPVSPFNLLGEGYYLIFQDLDSGEKV